MDKTKKLRSPITWFGGKGAMAAKLLGLMPPHKFYVEPFGGGASLLFAKEPSAVETYNDADEGLVNFFRVMRDPELFNMFYHLVLHTPFSRAEYNYCRETWANETDPVMMAYKWFVVARNSFAGNFGASWGYGVTSSNRGMASQTSRLLSIFELLPAIHARVMRVQIEHDSWEKVLARHNHAETLAYLDPPYIPDTRKSGGYAHELTAADHERLVRVILEYPGMVMLSGYAHKLYAPLEAAGWDRVDFETACMAAGRTRGTGIIGAGAAKKMQPRTETVWRNPAALKAWKQANDDRFKVREPRAVYRTKQDTSEG
jgi:DNA adenine methylase